MMMMTTLVDLMMFCISNAAALYRGSWATAQFYTRIVSHNRAILCDVKCGHVHAVSSASVVHCLLRLLLLTSAIYCSHVGDADQSLFLAIVAPNCLVQSLLCLLSLDLSQLL